MERFTLATVRKDTLLYLLLIPCNETVGGIHYHLCRTVILLEFEDSCPTITIGKTEYVAYIRTTKRIDALSIIANYTYRLARLCQLPNYTALNIVGILELIDQYITETGNILIKYIGIVAEQTIGIHQQVIEIHSIRKAASLGIPFIYLICRGNPGMQVIASQPLVILIVAWRYERTLCRRNPLGNSIGLVHLVIKLHLLDDALDKAAGIGLVIDGKLRVIPYVMRLTT